MVEEIDDDWLSTAAAAEALKVSRDRVRQLAATGVLPFRRLGGRYVLRREDVEARAEAGAAPGRSFSPRRSWALILLASGVPPDGVDGVTLSKLRRALREGDLWERRGKLGGRAERRDLRAHSSDLDRLEAEAGVVLTGPRHARDVGLGLIAPDAPVELYVDQPTAARLIARYSLVPSDRPNVRLRVVAPGIRAWLPGRFAPRLAVALDLADDRDPRAQAVAREALEGR